MDSKIQKALDQMECLATRLGKNGVATIIVQPSGIRKNITTYQRVVGQFFRPAQPELRGEDDLGTNYLIASFAKLGESMRTGSDSGTSELPLLRCELGWKGGIVVMDEGTLYIAFSGGTPEEDLEISQSGKNSLLS